MDNLHAVSLTVSRDRKLYQLPTARFRVNDHVHGIVSDESTSIVTSKIRDETILSGSDRHICGSGKGRLYKEGGGIAFCLLLVAMLILLYPSTTLFWSGVRFIMKPILEGSDRWTLRNVVV